MRSFGLSFDRNRALVRSILVALAVATASVIATAPAAASPRVAFELEMTGTLTGPNSVSGPFTSTVGSIQDSGTFAETFVIDGNTIEVVKIFTGTYGLIVLSAHTFLDFTTPTNVTFRGGRWRILFGTGAYAGLKGTGRPGAIGSADLALGTVAVSHRGKAHLR